jgi:hypothetical protein
VKQVITTDEMFPQEPLSALDRRPTEADFAFFSAGLKQLGYQNGRQFVEQQSYAV